MATKLTGIIKMPESPTDTYSFNFSENIPWGQIQSYSVTMTTSAEIPIAYAVTNVLDNKITIKTASPVIARFDVTVNVNSPYYQARNPVLVH